MNDINRKLNAAQELSKAKIVFEEAALLYTEGYYEGSMSRFYYAAFHAAKALLLTQGLEAKTHEGVRRLFSLHFIKSGKIEDKFSRLLSHAEQDRDDADYFVESIFTKADCEQRSEGVKEFLAAAELVLAVTG